LFDHGQDDVGGFLHQFRLAGKIHRRPDAAPLRTRRSANFSTRLGNPVERQGQRFDVSRSRPVTKGLHQFFPESARRSAFPCGAQDEIIKTAALRGN